MKKIKLNLDQLEVDSFEILKSKRKSGTVNGNIPIDPPPTWKGYCSADCTQGEPTCDVDWCIYTQNTCNNEC